MMYFLGLISGLILATLMAILLFIFRRETTTATNWIKSGVTKKGGFLETEQTLQDKHDEIWK